MRRVAEWKATRSANGQPAPRGPAPKGKSPDYNVDVGAALPGEGRHRDWSDFDECVAYVRSYLDQLVGRRARQPARHDAWRRSASWNPVTGCDQISPGCAHCYAKTFAERWRGVPGHPYEQGFDLRLWPERLELPLRWRKPKPKPIFVNSMSDLFWGGCPKSRNAKAAC